MPKNPDFPLPDTGDELTSELWAAAARGELRLPRCSACGAWNWYPRRQCPSCESATMTWEQLSGRGRLFSWAVVQRALLPQFGDLVPFVPALVTLDDAPGPRLVTRVVDCDPDDLQVDMPVEVVFRPLSFPGVERQVVAPLFTPVR